MALRDSGAGDGCMAKPRGLSHSAGGYGAIQLFVKSPYVGCHKQLCV